jgi:hypothetical protein
VTRFLDRAKAGFDIDPMDASACGLEHFYNRFGDFGPDPVAPDEGGCLWLLWTHFLNLPERC